MNTNKSDTAIAMPFTQLGTLLQEAKHHYLRRNLKKALNAARIAVEFSKDHHSNIEHLKAILLLGEIYNTNGQYALASSFFTKALEYVTKAEQLSEQFQDNFLKADILLLYGKIFLNQKNFSKAKKYFEQSLALAQSRQLQSKSVLALVGMSQLATAQNDFPLALEYATLALDSVDGEEMTLLSEVYNVFSQVYIKQQKYSESLEYSQALLAISRKLGDIEKELTALNNIAIVSGVKSNYKIAIQYFLEALNKSESIGFYHHIIHSLINIGTIYAHLYNYEEALYRYQIVLEEYENILEDNTTIIVYNNVGNIYYTTEKYDLALVFFEKALQLARQRQYKEMIAHSLAQLSRTNTALNDFEKAYALAREAHQILGELGAVNGRQINLINLGEIYNQKGNFDKALELTQEGIEVAKAMKDHTTEIRGYQLMANIYKTLGNFEQAFAYQLQYSNSREEFAKIQRNKQFLDLEIKYAIKEKQQEIEQLTQENKYQGLLLKKSEQIARQNEELLRVNEELKQFAYVASHDLKEPLRMIGSYTQLIQRLYKNQQTETSKLYFHYVTDGVTRMNNLLEALLKYATIGETDKKKSKVDLNYVLEICQVNLKVLIDETGAIIKYQSLPQVQGLSSLLTQLFQNLLSNAIKFRKPNIPPIIKVEAVEKEQEYLISITDNGIGIEKENQDRVFIIFQRLHSRQKYQGTGIGLSICQKIIQQLGGKIWLESELGKGTTFYFNLPKD